jgi:hypothetical protein
VGTRAAVLYRVKAAAINTYNNLEGAEGRLSTCKYGYDGIITVKLQAKKFELRIQTEVKIQTI